MNEAGRRPHDMGGQPAGKCEHDEHELEPWEARIAALVRLLSHPDRKMLGIDELRRYMEDMGAQAYDELSYHERWIHSVTQLLIHRGIVSIEEVSRLIEDKEGAAHGRR